MLDKKGSLFLFHSLSASFFLQICLCLYVFFPLCLSLSFSLQSCDFAVEMSNSAGIWAAANSLHKAPALSLSLSPSLCQKIKSGLLRSRAAQMKWMNLLPGGRTEICIRKEKIVSGTDCVILNWQVSAESLQLCTQPALSAGDAWGTHCVWIMGMMWMMWALLGPGCDQRAAAACCLCYSGRYEQTDFFPHGGHCYSTVRPVLNSNLKLTSALCSTACTACALLLWLLFF